MLRALFFDNDGVLVETEQLYYQATRDVMADVGVDLTPALYQEYFLIQGTGAWHLAANRGHNATVEGLRADRNARYARALATTPPLVDGIRDVLAQLHGKYILGCVTSSRRDHFDLIHRDSGLLPFFDFVVTSDDVKRAKPDPALYLSAMARAGCQADECVAIEDSARGLDAATAAGIRCLVVPTALTAGSSFDKATRVLISLRDVIPAIESLEP